jgi:hypothetical protein
MDWASLIAKGALKAVAGAAVDAHFKKKLVELAGDDGDVLFCEKCTGSKIGDRFPKVGFAALTADTLLISAWDRQWGSRLDLTIPRDQIFFTVNTEKAFLVGLVAWFTFDFAGASYRAGIENFQQLMRLLGPNHFQGWDKIPNL